MNRVLPIVLLISAVGLHFTYCEWDIRTHEKIVSPDRAGRTIFYSYHRRDRSDVLLLSKTADTLEEAKLYGVLLPLALLAAAAVIPKLAADTDYYSTRPRVEA